MKQLFYIIVASLPLFSSCTTKNRINGEISDEEVENLSKTRYSYVKNSQNVTDKVTLMQVENNDSVDCIYIPDVDVSTLEKSTYISSDLFDTIYAVPLETTDESVISYINKINIVRDTIYILENWKAQSLKRFTMNGKFIDVIGSVGNGKGEYVKCSDFWVAKDRIVVLDGMQDKIIYYDMQGNMLYDKKIPFASHNLAMLNDSTFLFQAVNPQNYHLDDMLNYWVWTTDTSFTLKQKVIWREKHKYETYQNDNILSCTNNQCIYCDAFSDTIYQITPEENIQHLGVMDFHGKRPIELYERGKKGELKKLEEQGLFYGLSNVVKSADYLDIKIVKDKTPINVFYSLKTKKIKYSFWLNPDDIQIGLTIRRATIMTAIDNTFVGEMSAIYISNLQINDDFKAFSKKLKEEKDSDIGAITERLVHSVEPDDNPILVFYKMKEW